MKVEKVTREMLRNIAIGDSVVFNLPNAAACDTAKAVAYQLKNIDGVKYRASTDYSKNSVRISKVKN